MVLNKRGVFFMMLALVIISLFLLSVTFFSGLAARESVQKRVETLSEFVVLTEEDLPRQLFIFGYRVIFLMENKIAQEGSYLGYGRFDGLAQEAFFNGTLDGQVQEILEGSTYEDLVELVGERAAKISATAEFANPSINFTQKDPWNVEISLNVDFMVRDGNGLAYWNKTLTSVSYVSIGNFTDPLYFKEAGVDKDIVRNPNDVFGSPAALAVQLEEGFYRNHSGAPSFIDRLEGNIGGAHATPRYSSVGIESFVHLEDDLGGGVQPQRSVVDYYFFNDGSHSSCLISGGGLPGWFRLDTPEHTNAYGVAC